MYLSFGPNAESVRMRSKAWRVASVLLRLARLPPPASRMRRSSRLHDTLTAAPGLLAHASVTEAAKFCPMGPNLRGIAVDIGQKRTHTCTAPRLKTHCLLNFRTDDAPTLGDVMISMITLHAHQHKAAHTRENDQQIARHIADAEALRNERSIRADYRSVETPTPTLFIAQHPRASKARTLLLLAEAHTHAAKAHVRSHAMDFRW